MKPQEIKEALITMSESVKESNGPAVVDSLNRIERFLGEHRAELHPQFAHFLERRSYAKAAKWIEDGNPIGRGDGAHGDVA